MVAFKQISGVVQPTILPNPYITIILHQQNGRTLRPRHCHSVQLPLEHLSRYCVMEVFAGHVKRRVFFCLLERSHSEVAETGEFRPGKHDVSYSFHLTESPKQRVGLSTKSGCVRCEGPPEALNVHLTLGYSAGPISSQYSTSLTPPPCHVHRFAPLTAYHPLARS